MSVDRLTAPIAHPDWCSIEFCDTSVRSDIEHKVLPDLWNTGADVAVSVGMSRDDEYGLPWRAGVRLQLEHLVYGTRAGEPLELSAYLAPTEAETLAHQLLAHAARARRAASEVGIDGQVA